jgi:hypothetical protein
MEMLKTLLASAAVLAAGAASAADIKVVPNGTGRSVISLDGDIVGGDATKLERLLQYRGLYAGIRLNSAGGNVTEGIELAKLVRKAELPATVPAGGECSSACSIVWLCAVEHHAEGAKVGVHGAAAPNGDEDDVAYGLDTWVARIVKDCGAPPAVVAAFVTVPANSIYWIRTEPTPIPARPTRSVSTPRWPVAAVKQPYIDVNGAYVIPAHLVQYIGQPWPARPSYQAGLAVVRVMFGQHGPVSMLADGSVAISALAATRTLQVVVRTCLSRCTTAYVNQSMDEMIRETLRRAGVS